MKIVIETPNPGEDDEIIVRCANMDDNLKQLLERLRSKQDVLIGYQGDKIVRLLARDIYYFEAVDNKVFAYANAEVYEVRRRLYELEELYADADFMRISKSMIANISKLAYLRPTFNGRFEARLKNNEKLIISRQYVANLKQKLGV